MMNWDNETFCVEKKNLQVKSPEAEKPVAAPQAKRKPTVQETTAQLRHLSKTLGNIRDELQALKKTARRLRENSEQLAKRTVEMMAANAPKTMH